jgi:hypothetical protein
MQAFRNPKIAAAARALNDTRHAAPGPGLNGLPDSR